jgi:hypothetical protein
VQLRGSIGLLCLASSLTGCGSADKVPVPDTPAAEVNTAAKASPPTVAAPSAEPAAVQATSAQSGLAPCPPVSKDLFCSGPIIVRASTPVLVRNGRATSDGSQRIRTTIGFTVESRTGSELRFNLADQEAKLTLSEIATVLSARLRDDELRSGVSPCRQQREACVQGAIDSFIKVEPGATPPRFQLFPWGTADGSVAGQLGDVTVADVEFEAYVVTPDGQTQTIAVSFQGLPIQNQTAK